MKTAILLAAGRGSRLKKYTRHLPKALARAGGRSLLDWHLHAFRSSGFERIVIAGGYRIEHLQRSGIELVSVPDWHDHGPLASLIAVQPERFDEGFLVVYADCPHHPGNLRLVHDCAADVAVAGDRQWRSLWEQRHGDPLIDAETYGCHDGRIISIGGCPTSLEEVQAQFAGLLYFSAKGWRETAHVLESTHMQPTDMTGLLDHLIREGVSVGDVPIDGGWCEIDSANDLRLCRQRLLDKSPWIHDWRETKSPMPWE
jgi:choline kinase